MTFTPYLKFSGSLSLELVQDIKNIIGEENLIRIIGSTMTNQLLKVKGE